MLEVAAGSLFSTSQVCVIISDREKCAEGGIGDDAIQINRMRADLLENSQ